MFKAMAVLAGIVAAVCLTMPERVAAARLVRDINTESASAANFIGPHAELGNVLLFAIDDGVHGIELWSSDGSPAGTHLVRDINPGPASSDPNMLTVLNGAAYFFANDGTNGTELWRSDGTTAGTAIVANIGPGSAGFGGEITNGRPIKTHAGILYFMADDTQSGRELWRSDGTRAGTYRLIDLLPGGAGSEPTDFTTVGQYVFFAADDGTHGRELWRTDGTVDGTRLVFDIAPGSASGVGGLFGAAVAGNALYFGANDGTHGGEPWRATADGAAMIADLNTQRLPIDPPGHNDSSNPRDWLAAGDSVLFIAQESTATKLVERMYSVTDTSITAVLDMPPFTSPFLVARFTNRTLFRLGQSGGGGELWATDGTAVGTVQLRPGGVSLFPPPDSRAVVQTATEAFFYASTSSSGNPTTLWRTDGTSAGTREFGALPNPGSELVMLGDKLYFQAGINVDPAGAELWVSDGTPAGTHRVADINPGPANGLPFGLFTALGKLFFEANDGMTGVEPWVSDGTEAGTIGLGDLNSVLVSQSSDPDITLPFGNGALLVADDGRNGTELWFSDGTTGGTQLVADISPGPASSGPSTFVELQGFALFVANDGVSGRELWRTDGTAMGTQRVLDIAPGAAGGAEMVDFGAVVLNGVAYFSADDGANGVELWRSDGTAAGTFMVADSTPGSGNTGTLVWGVVGQRVVYRYQNRLWSTDGTPAGTAELRNDIEVLSTLHFDVAVLNGHLYFAARDDQSGDAELWRTDGTPAGTEPVTDLPNDSLFVSSIQAVGNKLFFGGCTQNPSGCGLYASDGTNAGTHRILEGLSSVGGVNDGTRLFFVDGRTLPEKLMVSDGTAAGTVSFLPAGIDLGGGVGSITWFQGGLIFTVNDVQRGPVIWRSDGSASGTRRILDLDPGVDTSRPPRDYTPIGTRLFFTANSIDTGNELYILDDDRPFANADTARTDFNVSTRIGVLDNDAAFSGSLVRSSVELTVLPASGNATIDATTGEILYVPNSGCTGTDTLQYRVRDDRGRVSDSAMVFVIVGAAQGEGPGTAPPPPPPPPPPNNPGNSGGGGGGGSFEWLLLIALAVAGVAKRRRASR